MRVKCFEDLEIWQLARLLTNKIYDIEFDRNFGLANQMCRAAVSVMSNIAEGFERDGNQEFIQFLSIAKASCGELRSQLYIAHDRQYINANDLTMLICTAKTISAKIMHLVKHLKHSRMAGIKYKTEPRPRYEDELQKIYREVMQEVEKAKA